MTPAVIALVVSVVLRWSLPAGVAEAISEAVALRGGDTALVLAVCAQESALGRTRAPLCGAHGRSVGRGHEDQARIAARAFPASASRRAWSSRLVLWRCGFDAECRVTTGAAYARNVLWLRDRLARAASTTHHNENSNAPR